MNKQLITIINNTTGEKGTSYYKATLGRYFGINIKTIEAMIGKAESAGGYLTTRKYTVILSMFLNRGE